MSLILDGSASVTINSGAILGITSGTAVASTSGTSIDFTSIPSWVKRITVMFNSTSLSGSSNILVQIGAGSVTSTGYVALGNGYSAAGAAAQSSTSGFPVYLAAAASAAIGHMVITNISSNIWVSSHSGTKGDSLTAISGGGNVTLGGTLDRIRITTVNGTDTFDAGSINILYE